MMTIETATDQMAAYLTDTTDEIRAGLKDGKAYCYSIGQICDATGVPRCIAGKVRLHFRRALAQAMTPGRDPVYAIEPTFLYGKTALLVKMPNNAVRGAAKPRTLDGLVGDSE